VKAVPCVLSVADHTGWSHVVRVAAYDNVPAVIERRRSTLIDSGVFECAARRADGLSTAI
jgi:hypothetical protein